MNKVARATLGLIIVTILAKILGFGKEIAIGSMYGATVYSDIFITSMNIPEILFLSIGLCLGTTFIPLYYENHVIGEKEKASMFMNNILHIVLAISLILSLLAFIFSESIVRLFAVGFEGEVFRTTVKFTRIMIFGGIFTVVGGIFSSYLQVNDKFIVPGLIGIPYNIIIIIFIVLSVRFNNIYLLPIGTLLAMFSQLIFQLPFVYKNGYSYKFKFDIKDEYIKRMIWLIVPVFLGVTVNQINLIVDKSLASTLVEGSISALSYANKLIVFILGILIASIATVGYPNWSKLSTENNIEGFNKSVIQNINISILILTPISIGAIILANPIVTMLFERGAFDARATQMTSDALVFYSIGLVAIGLRELLGKVFYSLQDTKTPMLNGSIAIGLNIALSLLFIKYIGHKGLALATSISAMFCVVLLFIKLKKKKQDFNIKKILITFIKCLISSLIMGIVIKISYYKLLLSQCIVKDSYIVILLCILIGFIIYGLLVTLLKVDEAKNIITIVISKSKMIILNTIYRK